MYLAMGIFVVVAVVLDQVSKALTVANIPLGGWADAIKGVFHFTYVQNRGAAFSMLQGQKFLWLLMKKPLPFTKLEYWCMAAIIAGGLGNFIDRIRLGYVVDMICTDFITFPVFNVADSFVTCGVVLLIIHLVFFNREFWKDEKK